jgi:ComF family protein
MRSGVRSLRGRTTSVQTAEKSVSFGAPSVANSFGYWLVRITKRSSIFDSFASKPSTAQTPGEYIDRMLGRLIEGLAAALPGQCAVCHAWPAQPLCEACVARFAQPQPRCRRCAIPVASGVAECGRCLAAAPPLDACHAALAYQYPWAALITQYKFNGQAGWARGFATLMRSAPWFEPALEDADVVLPMPLSRQRLAERGFNQALLLARALAPQKTDAGLLLRVRHTTAQTALDRKQRLDNVKGAFAVDPLRTSLARGKRIVLVDDVMTSGASLFSAAHAVRQAGSASITALVLARTDEQ